MLASRLLNNDLALTTYSQSSYHNHQVGNIQPAGSAASINLVVDPSSSFSFLQSLSYLSHAHVSSVPIPCAFICTYPMPIFLGTRRRRSRFADRQTSLEGHRVPHENISRTSEDPQTTLFRTALRSNAARIISFSLEYSVKDIAVFPMDGYDSRAPRYELM